LTRNLIAAFSNMPFRDRKTAFYRCKVHGSYKSCATYQAPNLVSCDALT